jgi:hypothetical protein
VRIIKDWRYLLGVMAALVFGLVGCLPTDAAAADYTWSGGGGFGAEAWSDGANWLGGVAPNSGASISTLTFPESSSLVGSENDLSGVSVEQLQLDNTHGLGLRGNGLSLGSGGLTLGAESRPPNFSTVLAVPLTLTADQMWNIEAPVAPGLPDDVGLTGQLTGESANLSINLNTYADLAFGSFFGTPTGPDDEIGDTTITGSHIEGGARHARLALPALHKHGQSAGWFQWR